MLEIIAVNYDALLTLIVTWILGGAFGLLGSVLFKALLIALGFSALFGA
jgi:hypothetical protein